MSLGRGEVSAAIDALGRSEVAETQFSGVWWIVHKNTAGEVVGELLEIALISTLLGTSRDEVDPSAKSLSAILEELPQHRPVARRWCS